MLRLSASRASTDGRPLAHFVLGPGQTRAGPSGRPGGLRGLARCTYDAGRFPEKRQRLLCLRQEEPGRDGRPEVRRHARDLAALLLSRSTHWDEGTFKEGLGFDGSSIRGWMGIHESDMLAMPDPDTACIDPFFAKPTVSVIANIVDPVTRQGFHARPAACRAQGRGVPEAVGRSPTPASSGPSRSSSSSTRSATSRTSTAATTRSTRPKARGTRRASRSRTSATSRASRAATSR